jgi:hypothetical protein
MDHFNATVQNGHLVHTRRGMQVSKQKFKGLSFVNSSPQTFTSGESRQASTGPRTHREFRFVQKEQEPRGNAGVRGPRKAGGESERTFKPSVLQAKKQQRRTSGDQHSTAGSMSSVSSRRSSSTASDELQLPSFLNSQPFDLFTAGATCSTAGGAMANMPTWSTHDLPTYMSAENRLVFHRCFSFVPRKLYPFEDILTYNPAKSTDFYYAVIKDLAALHCVLMCGSLTEALIKRNWDTKAFTYHISKICAILNRKLDQSKSIEPITLESILTLALVGVSLLCSTLVSHPALCPFGRNHEARED